MDVAGSHLAEAQGPEGPTIGSKDVPGTGKRFAIDLM